MIKQVDLVVSPSEAEDEIFLKRIISEKISVSPEEIFSFKILKKSVDARSRNIKINLRLDVYINELPAEREKKKLFQNVKNKNNVLVVGAGPAGLFAALRLIELGVKPVIIERGKDVKSRRRDLAAINKQHIVNPDSNYCFGEGGAGTYSDGKLYTRSTKRGDVNKILELFVEHGADENILTNAHPHIGTNKLPKIIENMRQSILEAGGEIHFNTRVVDLILKDKNIQGVVTEDVNTGNKTEFISSKVILATGHSSRDIFEFLYKKQILIEAKPFALGVRIEHPQSIIDSIQYHCKTVEELDEKRKFLPAASYSLVEQVEGRGVYSFCMCPGGIIAPCATAPGEVVTNGWSPSKRNNPFANSGIVVEVKETDFARFKEHGPLAALYYQKEVEHKAFLAGGGTQSAPAQRMIDFVNNKLSEGLMQTSYTPGVNSADLYQVLPPEISSRLRIALVEFGEKMRGYYTNEAILVAVESRTSSPVRIPRDKESLEHPEISGLYPCGEGAGYAGGIISAAIDGEKCAEAAFQNYS
jgi:uncharacterized protein